MAGTTWHITFGTHGTRLHGDDRLTVERRHNQLGEAFVEANEQRAEGERERMGGGAVYLTREQRLHIERVIPSICERGGWSYRIAAAPGEADHVHVLLDADPAVHGKQIRQWLKRWLGESLSECFGTPPRGWWAEGGSTKAAKGEKYRENAHDYIHRQRTTPT